MSSFSNGGMLYLYVPGRQVETAMLESAMPMISTITKWIKNNPIYSLVGSLGTVTGALAGAPPAWQAVSQTIGIPECVNYSAEYDYYNGRFMKDGKQWLEMNETMRSGVEYTFMEVSRNPHYITLLNKTPRNDPRWSSMLVRLPVCGGTAQWTYENPERWTDLYQVERKARSIGTDG